MYKFLSLRTKIHGFTLVELSIVIIIIGFLIAGISGGSSLIKTSKLSAIISDIKSIDSVTRQFKYTYGELPGDITNATSYFGTTDKNGFTITNGNGDGYIGNPLGTQDTPEGLAAPQQLALTGLIPGIFTGESDPNGNDGTIQGLTIGKNIMGSRTGIGYYYMADNYWSMYSRAFNQIIPTTNFSVEDSYFIDSKIDDGKPLTGKILSQNWTCSDSTTHCFNGNECSPTADKTVSYNLASGAQCHHKYSIDDEYLPN